ncbi:MAG: hypothetical protein MI757_22810, partial [Pirellulales bacterium]|nr:hypothetical protein [Pirellulales bacterium]
AIAIGVGWKWVRGDFDHLFLAQPTVNHSDKTTSDESPPAKKPSGPLIEPIHVPGVMPGWQATGDAALHTLVSATDIFAHDSGAVFHAHGEEICASGCAASNHPTKELTADHFQELMAAYAVEPMSEDSPSLESLLYFGRQTREMIEADGFGPLDSQRARFLWNELARTHAHISMRVVDEHGEVRSWLEPTEVPFDRRHVFDMHVKRVQPLYTSGTVKRVGLYHLWTRL